jgi:glycerophosphoryl diester phosphodiesterase
MRSDERKAAVLGGLGSRFRLTARLLACLSAMACIQACAGGESPDPNPVLDGGSDRGGEGQPYWRDVDHTFATSPRGNVVGVACHDCYGPDLASTHAALSNAQQMGADIVELDLQVHGGVWSVGRDGDSSGAVRLADLLAGTVLGTGGPVLSLELEQREPSAENLSALLALLIEAGMADPGRMIVLRCFDEIADNLRVLRRLIEREAGAHASAFRLQVMYATDQVQSLAVAGRLLQAARQEGWQGVEFNHRSKHIFELLHLARERGFGTNVWTFSAEEGAAKCELFRNLTDTVTTDSSPQACRLAIESSRD